MSVYMYLHIYIHVKSGFKQPGCFCQHASLDFLSQAEADRLRDQFDKDDRFVPCRVLGVLIGKDTKWGDLELSKNLETFFLCKWSSSICG